MSLKEDLENSIFDIYRIIRESDQQIPFVDPKKQLQLQRENDKQWSYIRDYLITYTALCERMKLPVPEEIIQLTAARFDDLAIRLIAIQTPKHKPSPPEAPPIPREPLKGNISPQDVPDDPWEEFLISNKSGPGITPLWGTPNVESETIEQAPPHEKEPLPFRMNYHFVHQFMPMDREEVAQFVITFSNRGDVDTSSQGVATHICLVLDVSGSMIAPDKYPYLLQAIPYVFEILSDNDWLSIILFSAHSELVWSQDVPSCRGKAQEIIQRIEQSGVKFAGTNLAPGLQKAIDEIKYFNKSHPKAVARLYILTDGQLFDAEECYRFNAQLQQLKIEVNAFGFGQDFAEDTIREIMRDCPGGRVQWISDTKKLWQTFYHIGEVAQNIMATDTELELTFSPNISPGDAFRFEPGREWYGSIDDRSKRFFRSLGTLEKDREYIYAFEARVYPSQQRHEGIATAILRYLFKGERQVIKQDIFIDRTSEQERIEQLDKAIKNIFQVLDGLRSKHFQSVLGSFQALLELQRERRADPAYIRMLEKVIDEVTQAGTLEVISEWENRLLRADDITVSGSGYDLAKWARYKLQEKGQAVDHLTEEELEKWAREQLQAE